MKVEVADVELGEKPEKGSIAFSEKKIKKTAKKINEIYKSRQLFELFLYVDDDVISTLSSMLVEVDDDLESED